MPVFTLPLPEPASTPQVMFPSESVSSVEAPVQFSMVPSLIPPRITMRPSRVEVAVVLARVMVTPPPKVLVPAPETVRVEEP